MSMAIKRASYTGDPGLFGDIFGALKGAVGGAIGSFGRQPPVQYIGPGSVPVNGGATRTPGFIGMAQRFVPGGASGYQCAPNGDMSGYHLNKSDYFLKSGEFVPAGSRYVRNRKRNPANARATSRAISRVSGAKTYQNTLSRITIRKKC